MRAGGDLRAHDGRLRLKQLRKKPLKSVAANVVVAIARGRGKVARADLVASVKAMLEAS